MSVRYMEGFETIQMYRDLVARGAVPSATANSQLQPSPGPARYAGGKALIRSYTTTGILIQRDVGAIGTSGGLALSYAGHTTSFNTLNSNRFPVRFIGGKYVGSAIGANPASITIADDFRYWPAQQSITTASSVALDVAYDATRNEYVALTYANATSNQFFVSPTLTSTAWAATSGAMSGNPQATTGRLYQDASGTMIAVTTGRIYSRAPGAATAWIANLTYGTASLVGGAAFDGTKWFVPINGVNNIITSADGGLTWVTSGTIANTSGQSIAAKPGTIVIGRSGSQPVAVSKDGGATFTLPSVPNPPSGGVLLSYGNGIFVAMPQQAADAFVYTSVDGLTWKSYPLDKAASVISDFSFANGYFFVAQSGPINGYSADGVTWNWNESPTYGSTGQGFGGLTNVGANFQIGFSPTNAGNLEYRVPSGKGTVAVITVGPRPADTWDILECAITRDNATTYTATASLNSVPFDTRSFTWALMTDVGLRTYPTAGTGYGAYNGTVAVMPAPIAGMGIMYSTNKGDTVTSVFVSGLGGSSCRQIVWTGTRFLAFSSAGVFASADGMTGWALIPGSPAFAFLDVDVQGSTIIAVGHASGAYYRSTDGGSTWVNNTTSWGTGYTYSGIAYLNGVWIAQPTWTGGGLRDGKWSNDDGVTWQTISMWPSYDSGHAKSDSVVMFTSNQGILRVTVPTAGQAPVLDNRSAAGPSGIYGIGWSGKYFVASSQNTTSIWYSTDGSNWTNFATTSGTGATWVLGVNGALIRYGGGASTNTVIYPELQDLPLAFQVNGRSHSAIDDVVVTDFAQPNAGPQGEVRVLLMPSDTDMQAQWAKVPDTAPTNAAAATKLPVTLSYDTYVEANDVGLKDKYGTSAFTYPSGLRPVAIQVEAFYERVFTNTPTVKLGLEAATTEVQTPNVTVASSLGQNTYVSKVVETNPDNGGAWSRASINGTKLTNEKTG